MYFNNVSNILDLKAEYVNLMKVYHPDVTLLNPDEYDVVGITQAINEEYQEMLNNDFNPSNGVIHTYTPKPAEKLYVNIYMAKAHIQKLEFGVVRYHKMECVKSILVDNKFDAERVIKGLKDSKMYNFLSKPAIKNCDRNGYITAIELGGTYLSNFFHSYDETEKKDFLSRIY